MSNANAFFARFLNAFNFDCRFRLILNWKRKIIAAYQLSLNSNNCPHHYLSLSPTHTNTSVSLPSTPIPQSLSHPHHYLSLSPMDVIQLSKFTDNSQFSHQHFIRLLICGAFFDLDLVHEVRVLRHGQVDYVVLNAVVRALKIFDCNCPKA